MLELVAGLDPVFRGDPFSEDELAIDGPVFDELGFFRGELKLLAAEKFEGTPDFGILDRFSLHGLQKKFLSLPAAGLDLEGAVDDSLENGDFFTGVALVVWDIIGKGFTFFTEAFLEFNKPLGLALIIGVELDDFRFGNGKLAPRRVFNI